MSQVISFKFVSLATLLLTLFSWQPVSAKSLSHDDVMGDWVIIDEIYGSERAVGRMKKDKKGNYVMFIVKNNLKMPEPKTHCVKCPGKFKGKPIMGLPIMWNVKPIKGKPGKFSQAYGLDPYEGTMFKGTMELSKNKNILKIRATPLEVSFVGKKFMFIRKQ